MTPAGHSANYLGHAGRARAGVTALVDYLDRYNYVAGLGINGDCLPAADNFLELATERGTRGRRKPLIHFSYGVNEKAMSAHADRFARLEIGLALF
jgi:hypothetical protein